MMVATSRFPDVVMRNSDGEVILVGQVQAGQRAAARHGSVLMFHPSPVWSRCSSQQPRWWILKYVKISLIYPRPGEPVLGRAAGAGLELAAWDSGTYYCQPPAEEWSNTYTAVTTELRSIDGPWVIIVRSIGGPWLSSSSIGGLHHDLLVRL